MSPEQIVAVQVSWRTAMWAPDLMVAAVSRALPDDPTWPPDDRAAWIVEFIDRSVGLLARPRDLMLEAAKVVDRRPTCPPGALAAEHRAFVRGLDAVRGPLRPALHAAWTSALHLYAEILAEMTLDPFALKTDTAAT